jgi:hypothetical protein
MQRQTTWKFFTMLPQFAQESLVRHKACVRREALGDVRISLATSTEDYLGSFRLVHDAYVRRGWIEPRPNGMWVTRQHMLPESSVLVMKEGERLIGTLSLTDDSPVGLPADRIFADHLAALRGPDRRLVEIGTLALAADVRGTGHVVLMYASAMRYLLNRTAATHAMAVISPHVGALYGAMWGAQALGPIRSYALPALAEVGPEDDPVICMSQAMGDALTFVQKRHPRPAGGYENFRSLVLGAFPARHEDFPDKSREELIRFKLPRDVLTEVFGRQTSLLPDADEVTLSYLARYRTRETLNIARGVTPPGRGSRNA